MFSAFLTALAGILGAVITALLARATIRNEASQAYGKLRERVDEHGRRIDDLEKDGDRQWDRIVSSEKNIVYITAKLDLNGGVK